MKRRHAVPPIPATAAAVFFSLFLAYPGTLIMWSGMTARGNDDFDYYAEVFARLFVCSLVAAGLFICWKNKALVFDRTRPRWLRGALAVLAAGFGLSALDPVNAISQEENVIRYFTSGFLLAASLVLVPASLRAGRLLFDRVVGIGFAVLFTLAAVDEVLELHEGAGDLISTTERQVMHVDTQDLTTLFVALLGIVGSVVAFFGLRILKRFPRFGVTPRHERSVYLFCAACLVFMAAMMLDSFDWAVEDGVNAILALAVFARDGATFAFLEAQGLIIRAANSVEEFLELTAAMLFFAMAQVFTERAAKDGRS